MIHPIDFVLAHPIKSALYAIGAFLAIEFLTAVAFLISLRKGI